MLIIANSDPFQDIRIKKYISSFTPKFQEFFIAAIHSGIFQIFYVGQKNYKVIFQVAHLQFFSTLLTTIAIFLTLYSVFIYQFTNFNLIFSFLIILSVISFKLINQAFSFIIKNFMLATVVLFKIKISSRCSIIHLHDIKLAVAGIILHLVSKKPLIWDAHEAYAYQSLNFMIRTLLYKAIIYFLSKNASLLITVSNSLKNLYSEYSFKDTLVIENALPKNQINEFRNSENLRKKLSIQCNSKIAVFHGSLGKNRGIEKLIDFANNNLPPQWYLLFIGKGFYTKEIKLLAGMNTRVKFLEFVDHEIVHNYLSQCDAGFILYDHFIKNHELSLPNKLWDFAIHKIPVISSDLTELTRLINSYKLGYILPKNFTSADIRNALIKIESEKIKINQSDLRFFIKKYNWDNSMKKYFKRLYKIMGMTNL